MKFIIIIFLFFGLVRAEEFIEDQKPERKKLIFTFGQLMEKINKHSMVQGKENMSKAIKFLGEYKSSLKDPMVKLDAMNFPEDDTSFGKTPMSSIGLSISQQIPLTGRLGYIERSFREKSLSENEDKVSLIRKIKKKLWILIIELYKSGTEQSILNENISWLEQMIRVTSKQYTTGKTSQEALLDLQVRKKVF